MNSAQKTKELNNYVNLKGNEGIWKGSERRIQKFENLLEQGCKKRTVNFAE